jgi:hypothetical protein
MGPAVLVALAQYLSLQSQGNSLIWALLLYVQAEPFNFPAAFSLAP